MKKPFKSFIIDKDFDGSRVDRFLKKQFTNMPQSLFEKNFRKKNITVNSRRNNSRVILSDDSDSDNEDDFVKED